MIDQELMRNRDGFYLIKRNEDFYLAFICNIPTWESTLKEAEAFMREPIEGAICFTQGWPPQMFGKTGCDYESLDRIGKEALEKSGLTTEDVSMPFIGGILGFDFRELFKRLFAVEERTTWAFTNVIRAYYQEVFEKIRERFPVNVDAPAGASQEPQRGDNKQSEVK